jgi:O-antigen/teichoic acid export membrane protein
MGILAIGGASGVTLLAPEISTYIGTEEYEKSALLIGFLCLTGIIEILNRLRGFGPLISNNTGLLTLAEAIGIILGISMLILLQNLGLLGIGIAFLVLALVKYFILTNYTVKKMNLDFNHWNDILLLSFSLISLVSVYFEVLLVYRSILILITFFTCVYMLKELYDKRNISLKELS